MFTYKIFNFQKKKHALNYKLLHVYVISEIVLAKNKQKPYTHHNQTPDTYIGMT